MWRVGEADEEMLLLGRYAEIDKKAAAKKRTIKRGDLQKVEGLGGVGRTSAILPWVAHASRVRSIVPSLIGKGYARGARECRWVPCGSWERTFAKPPGPFRDFDTSNVRAKHEEHGNQILPKICRERAADGARGCRKSHAPFFFFGRVGK